MTNSDLVQRHYHRAGLASAIRAGLSVLGKTPQTTEIADLAPVDEFHIGGRAATQALLDQLRIDAAHTVLDAGCGIGGASRFAAETYGCQVQGVDLTREYVDCGNTLCEWLGLQQRVRLQQGSVLDLPFADASVDRAFMLHVGMNIAAKDVLAAEVWRVLRPGGFFGIYDVMRLSDEPLVFPVPWAGSEAGSAVASPEQYKEALSAADFDLVAERNRHAFAIEFFERLQKNTNAAGGPPPLGLHLLMGEQAPQKIANMIANVGAGRIAPVELIAQKRT